MLLKFPILFALVLFFGISRSTCNAQNYFHSPNDTLVAYTLLDGQVTMNITQVHPTNDTLYFIWNLLQVNMPVEWEATICDNSQCYTGLEISGATLPVLPGDNGIMLVHCIPHLIHGTGTIRYTIYEIGNPSVIDTLTWIIHTSTASILEQNLENEIVVFYTENQLNFKGNIDEYEQVRIIDQVGRIIFDGELKNKTTLPILNLNPGFIWIELRGKSNYLTKKICIYN